MDAAHLETFLNTEAEVPQEDGIGMFFMIATPLVSLLGITILFNLRFENAILFLTLV